MNNNKHKDHLVLFALISITVIYCLPFLSKIQYYPICEDWLLYLSFIRYVRDSLLTHHQFPLWCPYLGGGFFIFSYPIFTALHPSTITSVIFGEVFGIKIDIVIFHVICVLGMFYLTRHHLKYSYPGVLLATLLLILNYWFFDNILLDGNYLESWYFAFPLIFFFFLKSQEQKIYRITTALMLALMLLTVKFNFLAVCSYLVLYIFIDCLIEKKWWDLLNQYRNLFYILILSFLYAMVKLLPVSELVNINSRVVIQDVFKWPSYETIGFFFKYLVDNLGIAQMILCLGALMLSKKESLKWFILLIIFALISLEARSPFNIAAILYQLPVFRSMSEFSKYYGFFFIFSSALMSGKFLTLLSHRMINKQKHILIALICIFTLGPFWIRNYKLQKELFQGKLPSLNKEEAFYQIEGINLERDTLRTPGSLQYFNIIRNIGTIDWYTDLPMDEPAIPKYFIDSGNNVIPNKWYKGEVFSKDSENIAVLKKIAVNTIILGVIIKKPGKVVINQSFHKYWNTSKGSLSECQGLLCLELLEKGKYSVILNFVPTSFYVGLIVTIASLFITCVLLYFVRKRPLRLKPADKKFQSVWQEGRLL